jgi:uncharacterized protein YbcV (DUF1398 family)
MNTEIIAQCMTLSFQDTPFPIVVGKLAGAGVRAYTADLIGLRSRYYGDSRATVEKAIPLAGSPTIADGFDTAAVAAAVRSIQAGDIGYGAFLGQIMRAGCASYSVYISGRRAIYTGRDGAFHIEEFPAPAG